MEGACGLDWIGTGGYGRLWIVFVCACEYRKISTEVKKDGNPHRSLYGLYLVRWRKREEKALVGVLYHTIEDEEEEEKDEDEDQSAHACIQVSTQHQAFWAQSHKSCLTHGFIDSLIVISFLYNTIVLPSISSFKSSITDGPIQSWDKILELPVLKKEK